MDNLIGQLLGRYRLQALLSQGRLGNVYQGIDINLERPVALKVLHPTVTSQPDFMARLTPIARAAVRLEHPGVVQVLDFGQVGEQTYIAMRLLEGPTLARLLHDLRITQQWIALPTAIQLVRQVGLALDYLQRQGVTQRQVLPAKLMFKWENTLLSASDEVCQPVLIDLGLSTLLNDRTLLQKQVNLQQLAYLPPEAVLSKAADGRGDVYALGALLYELTVGQPPLLARTVGEAVDAHLNQTIPPAKTLHPALPGPVAALIEQALAYEPSQRFATVREMVDSLVAIPANALPPIVPPSATAGAGTLTQQARQQPAAPAPAPVDIDEPTARLANEEPVNEPAATLAAMPVYQNTPARQPVDQIQIIAPDSTTRTLEVNQPALTIGRINDNDLVLDDPRISRKHARIEVENGQWRVVDLHSANGTFIGKTRVPPGDVTPWGAEQLLRLGNYRLRLLRGQSAPAAESAMPAPVSGRAAQRAVVYIPSLRAEVAQQDIQSSADGVSVGLFLKESDFGVDPGTRLSIPLVVLNQKNVAGLFTFSVTGVPSAWCQFTPARCEVAGGEQRQVFLEIEPSRTPQSRPGRYTLQVAVTSQQQPDQRALGELQLTVKPFIRFRAEAQPPVVAVGEPMRISIENEGNQLQNFKLLWWEEPSGELHFAEESAELQVLPGESESIEFHAEIRKQRWLGGERAHLVKVQISTQQHAVQHLVVKMISRGRLR